MLKNEWLEFLRLEFSFQNVQKSLTYLYLSEGRGETAAECWWDEWDPGFSSCSAASSRAGRRTEIVVGRYPADPWSFRKQRSRGTTWTTPSCSRWKRSNRRLSFCCPSALKHKPASWKDWLFGPEKKHVKIKGVVGKLTLRGQAVNRNLDIKHRVDGQMGHIERSLFSCSNTKSVFAPRIWGS